MDAKQIEDDLISRFWEVKADRDHEAYIVEIKRRIQSNHDLDILNTLNKSYAAVAAQLDDLEEKPATELRHKNLVRQLEKINEKLKVDHYGNKLDRNQGLSLENYIYYDVIRDLTSSIKNQYAVCVIPHYKYAIESNFDHEPLKELLLRFINELNGIKFASYLELQDKFSEISVQIESLGKEEYEANSNKDH
jgi:hypothetical protein